MYNHHHLPRARAWGAHGCNDGLQQAFQRAFGEVAGLGSSTASSGESANGESAAAARWTPRIDIREEAGRFVIFADIPGVDPKDIEIQMDQGMLSFKGERKIEASQESDRWSRQERARGIFERRFNLPDTADTENIQATGRNGVLEISIPKKPQAAARKIQVN